MYESLRLIMFFFVFLGLFISLAFYFYFYRKYSRELSQAFQTLSNKKYLDVNDYFFYEQLGVPGFAYRVILMRKIIACKPIKRNGEIQLCPEAGKLISSEYNFSWVNTFHKITVFVVFLMFLLFVLVITGS